MGPDGLGLDESLNTTYREQQEIFGAPKSTAQSRPKGLVPLYHLYHIPDARYNRAHPVAGIRLRIHQSIISLSSHAAPYDISPYNGYASFRSRISKVSSELGYLGF